MKQTECKKCGKFITNNNYVKHVSKCTGIVHKKIRGIDYDPNIGYKLGTRFGWNKGLSKESDERVLKNSEAISKSLLGKPGHKHSIETKSKLSLSKIDKLHNNSFYSKRIDYNGVVLDSSYEFELAKNLDEHNIKWIRPKFLLWPDDDLIRRYIPDFYLPEYDIYLDPKNDYLINKDRRKIQLASEYNSVTILILNKHQLTWDYIKSFLEVDMVVPRAL